MADGKVKKWTVYCIPKKIPDDNYDVYVGSTCKPLSKRFIEHKLRSKIKPDKDSRYLKRLAEVGSDNWVIKLLFVNTCSKKEIRQFEKKWIRILDADLNMISPILDDERYKHQMIKLRKRNLEEKKYYCEVCEKPFQCNWSLNRHFDTLKHQFTYLNSLD